MDSAAHCVCCRVESAVIHKLLNLLIKEPKKGQTPDEESEALFRGLVAQRSRG